MRRALADLSGLLYAVTKVVTGCVRMTKDGLFSRTHEKYGTLSMYVTIT